jgi:hypothetical protein
MQQFNFQIVYKMSSEMPTDYLSHNVVDVIPWQTSQIFQEQGADPLIRALSQYLIHRTTNCPAPPGTREGLTRLAPDQMTKQTHPGCTVPLPVHGSGGSARHPPARTYPPWARERALKYYYWVGMDVDIATPLRNCQ